LEPFRRIEKVARRLYRAATRRTKSRLDAHPHRLFVAATLSLPRRIPSAATGRTLKESPDQALTLRATVL
jgi:hypothetical protein